MTRSAHFLALAIAAACFLLGGGAPDRAPSENTRTTIEPDARAASEPQVGFHDELAARQELTEPEAIRALEDWIQRKDALVDQFALYDAVARADADGLSAMLAKLDFHPDPMAREARYVIRLRMSGPAASASAPPDLASLTAAIARREYETDWSRMFADIRALCAVDAKGVWEAIQRVQDDFKRSEAQQTVLPALAEQSPVAGATAARELLRDAPLPRSRSLAQEAFVIALERDPAGIVRWYRSQTDAQAALIFVMQMLESRTPRNLASMELIELLPESSRKRQLILQTTRHHAESDLPGSLYWIDRSLPPADALAAKADLAGVIVRYDKRAALAVVDQLPDADTRARACARIAEGWASIDFDATLAWALDLREERSQTAAIAALARDWASKDFAAAASYTSKMQDADAKRILVAQLAQEYARNASADEIVQAMSDYPDPDLGSALASHAIRTMASTDPQGAWLALRSLGGQRDVEFGSHVSHIAHLWSRIDPRAAARELLPQGGLAALASIHYLVPAYAEVAPEEALDLVSLLPEGDADARRSALQAIGYNQTIAQDYPEIAADAIGLLEQLPSGRR